MKKIEFSILYKLLFISISICFLAGCKSTKTIVTSDGSVTQKDHEKVLDDALMAELNYNTISGKTSLELVPSNGKSGMKVNCYIKLVRDKDIQMSVRIPFINSEAVRLNLTPDSIFIIDRLHQKYVAEKIKNLDKDQKIQFNYFNVQALLTNSLFIPGKKVINKKDYNDYSISMNSGTYVLVTKDKSAINYSFIIDSKDRIIETQASSSMNDFSIKWSYLDFIKDASSFVYPTKMQAKINSKNKNIGFNISYSELEINKDVKIDKQIPSKYQRSSIDDVLKAAFK